MHQSHGRPLPHRLANAPRDHPSVTAEAVFPILVMRLEQLCGISHRFRWLSPAEGQVSHVLLTRSPLALKGTSSLLGAFDLHVLGTPPALILSQDQTLMKVHES